MCRCAVKKLLTHPGELLSYIYWNDHHHLSCCTVFPRYHRVIHKDSSTEIVGQPPCDVSVGTKASWKFFDWRNNQRRNRNHSLLYTRHHNNLAFGHDVHLQAVITTLVRPTELDFTRCNSCIEATICFSLTSLKSRLSCDKNNCSLYW